MFLIGLQEPRGLEFIMRTPAFTGVCCLIRGLTAAALSVSFRLVCLTDRFSL